MPANQIERLLRDFYAGKLSADDIEARLEVEVREEDFRNICNSALEGLAKRTLNLPMLVERRAMAQERRIVPETVARFFETGAREVSLPLTALPNIPRAFRVGRLPVGLYEQGRAKAWRLPPLARSYDRLCFDRSALDADTRLEWITPGHPLFEAVRRQVWDQKLQELHRRCDLRLAELARQRALSLQGVERIGVALVLPHPERNSPATNNLKTDRETERKAIAAVIAYEQARGCKIKDVQDQNLGFDLRSLHPVTGENRLIEVKGIGAATGTIFLSPNERRMSDERRDLYWLYIVTHCDTAPKLEEPIKDPARFPWHEVKKVEHYRLDVNAMTQPMELRAEPPPYGGQPA